MQVGDLVVETGHIHLGVVLTIQMQMDTEALWVCFPNHDYYDGWYTSNMLKKINLFS